MRRLVLVANPAASGFTASLYREVVALLSGPFDVTAVWPNSPDEARSVAAEAVAEGYDVVAAMGGDGIVHQVANGLLGGDTALGIIPGAGGTQRLPRMIGVARAKRWIFAAELHDADGALRDGVADRVVPADQLDAAAVELATTIASNGPAALRLAKRAIEQGAHLPLGEALELEWECYQGVLGTSDREEALRAFAEKRTPRFTGS